MNYHIIKRKNGWALQRSGAQRAFLILRTKEAAIYCAADLARLTTLYVHNPDGTVDFKMSKREVEGAAKDIR